MNNRDRLAIEILKGEVYDLAHKFVSGCPNGWFKSKCKKCPPHDDCERCWIEYLNDEESPYKRSKNKKKGNSSFE